MKKDSPKRFLLVRSWDFASEMSREDRRGCISTARIDKRNAEDAIKHIIAKIILRGLAFRPIAKKRLLVHLVERNRWLENAR